MKQLQAIGRAVVINRVEQTISEKTWFLSPLEPPEMHEFIKYKALSSFSPRTPCDKFLPSRVIDEMRWP